MGDRVTQQVEKILQSGLISADKLSFDGFKSPSGWETFKSYFQLCLFCWGFFCLCALCCCRSVLHYCCCRCFCPGKTEEKAVVINDADDKKVYAAFIPEKNAGGIPEPKCEEAPAAQAESGPILANAYADPMAGDAPVSFCEPVSVQAMSVQEFVEPMSVEPMSLGIEPMVIPDISDPMALTSVLVEPSPRTPPNEVVLGDLSESSGFPTVTSPKALAPEASAPDAES